VVEERWSEKLCGLLGIEPKELPEIIEPAELAGRLRAETAETLNLPPAIPVVTGTLDSASETLAAGVMHPGQRLVL